MFSTSFVLFPHPAPYGTDRHYSHCTLTRTSKVKTTTLPRRRAQHYPHAPHDAQFGQLFSTALHSSLRGTSFFSFFVCVEENMDGHWAPPSVAAAASTSVTVPTHRRISSAARLQRIILADVQSLTDGQEQQRIISCMQQLHEYALLRRCVLAWHRCALHAKRQSVICAQDALCRMRSMYADAAFVEQRALAELIIMCRALAECEDEVGLAELEARRSRTKAMLQSAARPAVSTLDTPPSVGERPFETPTLSVPSPGGSSDEVGRSGHTVEEDHGAGTFFWSLSKLWSGRRTPSPPPTVQTAATSAELWALRESTSATAAAATSHPLLRLSSNS